MIRFEFEWLDVPHEGDALECRTMARLTWKAGDHVLTRVHDRTTRSERDGIYVPLFPLADWLVTSWWSLLYEPWPFFSDIPAPGATAPQPIREWLQRHCVRAAIPGFAGPFTCLFSQGRQISLISRSDPGERYASTPVKFLGESEAALDRDELRGAFTEIVEAVLARVELSADDRVESLRADWQTICNATPAELEFCRAAGRLGLDPLAVETWPPEVAGWFESVAEGQLDSALVTDLLEATDAPRDKPSLHRSLAQIVQRLQLDASMPARGPRFDSPAAFAEGFNLADWIRSALKVAVDAPLADLEAASEAVCERPLTEHTAPIPEGGVLAIAGWGAHAPTIATREGGSPQARRFLRARALYLAARGAARGPRLVTDARTWDQRASRSFGAELLAPRAGVVALFESAARRFGRDEAELHVAAHYDVNPTVIRRQLDNARSSTH